MAACHNQKNWFVPFTDSVAGLSAEQAKWNRTDGHSVWQIVNHLIFWNEKWLIRFRGDVPAKMEGENSDTFRVESLSDELWQSTVNKFESILSEWEQRLKAADESMLSSEAFEGYGGTWYEVFTQTTIHNAYHVGQIVAIRKQQGSWNSDIGVK